MRPVLLDMAGFASFREPTTVDFAGAEYFALVGPTGSGKSTVIDAITFALYGSVPRWDDRRAVALALAPTVNRGAVRFVFDVGRARYVVARELRRAASGSVSVRSARLERLRDPSGTGGADEETEPVADGTGAVTTAVEELLGLPFGDFCTCVVLPQGEFAEFLHTEPRKRQEKLVRILGLGVYDQIAREANSEAATQRQRADLLDRQLDGYADATPEAARTADGRVAELTALAARVGTAVSELAAAAASLDAAEALVVRWRTERTQLAALSAPAGIADLDARQRAAAAALTTAAARADTAEAGDAAARRRLAAAPARGPLEQARRDHAELGALTDELPGARERHEKARAADDTAGRDAVDARAAVETARRSRDAAATTLATTHDVVRRLVTERDRLRSLAVPAGLDALVVRRSTAAASLRRAIAALTDAEAADARTRADVAAAPLRAPLEQARRDHRDLAAAEEEHAGAVGRFDAAQRDLAAAAEQAALARRHVTQAQRQRAADLRADLVAGLRPTLVAGDACPVCTQTVTVLPELPPAADPAVAERAVTDAEETHDHALHQEAAAAAERVRASADVERLAATIARLRGRLRDVAPPGARSDESAAVGRAVEEALAGLDRIARAAELADGEVRAARGVRETAARQVEKVRGEVGASNAALRAARDPLVTLGAPALEAPTVPADPDLAVEGPPVEELAVSDVGAGWRALVAWAEGEAGARTDALLPAREGAAAAERDRDVAEQALRSAERTAQDRRNDETAAARAEQEARGTVAALDRRVAELRSTLAGAPTDADAAAALSDLAARESAARSADTELSIARAAVRSAERAVLDVGREVTDAWHALRGARDPLVPLGAPALSGDDLLEAWTVLIEWAATQAVTRGERLAAAEEAATAARGVGDAVERRLTADLAAHGIVHGDTAGAGLAATAPPVVAAAQERARGQQERVAERRATAAAIRADRDEAESTQQVARMLGGLLRSDGFPRWLVASALDALVVDASASLAELSGGQFELTHDHGEFLVIDHADADTRRPVKTLSGGETFQASLALALALAAQMSGLAARGAARLESIFLDEGFGTLDEANLDVVASTLENLATCGDRVVGVITHVPALAERVPVRFTVRRDHRTSSVVREEP